MPRHLIALGNDKMNTSNKFMLEHFQAAAKHCVDSSVAIFEKLIEDEAIFTARDTGDTFAVFPVESGFVMLQMSPTYKPGFAADAPTGLANFQAYEFSKFADAVQAVAQIVITDCAHDDEQAPL